MKKQIISAVAGILLMSTGAFAEECVAPGETPAVAEKYQVKQELLDAIKAVQEFIVATDDFQTCLDKKIEAINPDADNADTVRAGLEKK